MEKAEHNEYTDEKSLLQEKNPRNNSQHRAGSSWKKLFLLTPVGPTS
jgi:hypothetical protein